MCKKERESLVRPSLSPVCHGDYVKSLNTANLAQIIDTDKFSDEKTVPILSMLVFEPKPKQEIRLRRPGAARTAATATRGRKTTKTTTTKQTKRMGKACMSGKVAPKNQTLFPEHEYNRATVVAEEGTDKEQTERLQSLLNKLEQNRILNVPDEDEAPALFTINGVEVIRQTTISLASAYKKSGKSSFAGVLMAASINETHEVFAGTIKSLKGQLNIVYLDTEQPGVDNRRLFRRMTNTAGHGYNCEWGDYGIHDFSLTDFEVDEMQDATLLAVKRYNPELLIIDGIADYLQSINDEEGSVNLFKWLGTVAKEYNCAILCMIHLNHGSTKMNGWIGSLAAKRQSDNFSLSKDPETEIFTVKHEGRGRSIGKFKFRVQTPTKQDPYGCWVAVDGKATDEAPAKTKKEMRADEIKALADDAPVPCKNGVLVKWVMDKKKCMKAKADCILRDCVKKGFLAKKKQGRYSIWYRPGNTAGEQSLPM